VVPLLSSGPAFLHQRCLHGCSGGRSLASCALRSPTNWLRPGQYLTLLTHSNLLLRPRAALSSHDSLKPLHVLVFTIRPSLSLSPLTAGTSPGCRSSSGRAFVVYVLSTWHSPGVFIPITMFTWAPPLTARSHSQRRTPNYVDSNVRRGTRISKVRTRL
jgi:hypothetical protein